MYKVSSGSKKLTHKAYWHCSFGRMLDIKVLQLPDKFEQPVNSTCMMNTYFSLVNFPALTYIYFSVISALLYRFPLLVISYLL